jgi:hypothetical protein
VVPTEGGEPIRITQIEKEGLTFESPRWSLDRKKIASAKRSKTIPEFWLVENFRREEKNLKKK